MNKLSTELASDKAAHVVVMLGIDLAKNIFALHGVNAAGKTILQRPRVRRDQLLDLLAQMSACTIGMEACSGAHHLARELIALGHTPKLMAPKFVTPYRMQGHRGKNDANDAAAICEAMSRPKMRFVPIKSVDAQATLTVHRVRQGFVEERTACFNRVRGLMAEFGVVLPLKADTVRRCARQACGHLPVWVSRAVGEVFENPQVQARGVAVDMPHPTAGKVTLVRSPMKLSATPAGAATAPPLLGQHTEEVLRDVLGRSADEIAALRVRGVL